MLFAVVELNGWPLVACLYKGASENLHDAVGICMAERVSRVRLGFGLDLDCGWRENRSMSW